ncbi:MAG TPA: CAP domain-containing protein [Steroidobacteraceae bacterium]|nr:CAP domain-containing protein [Steroidobacteraceae bacterium]
MTCKIQIEAAAPLVGSRHPQPHAAPWNARLACNPIRVLLACVLLAPLPWGSAGASALGARASVPASAPRALELLQTLRMQGCEGRPGTALALRRPPALQAAAARWAAGAPPEVALEAAGYRIERFKGLTYRGTAAGLRRALVQSLCAALTQEAYRDVGVWGQEQGLWIMLAAPFQAPSPADAATVRQELLASINAARAHARRCGSQTYPPAPPLRLDVQLTRAAERHARDMLEHDFFDHRGSDGSTPGSRAQAAGYRFHALGENIAEGSENVEQAVRAWLASPGHCANIMDRAFQQTGFAFAVNRRGAPRIYWVEDFGTP